MRLVPEGNDKYEVHTDNRLIGYVWKYDGDWCAMTRSGYQIPATWTKAETAGRAVEKYVREYGA